VPREGDEAIEDVEVAGEGGFVGIVLGSNDVTTLGGFLIRCDMLRRRLCADAAEGSERECVSGAIWSVLSFLIISSFACLRTGRFLKENEPKLSSPMDAMSSPLMGGMTGAEAVCRCIDGSGLKPGLSVG
jgi:hypothetical protein